MMKSLYYYPIDKVHIWTDANHLLYYKVIQWVFPIRASPSQKFNKKTCGVSQCWWMVHWCRRKRFHAIGHLYLFIHLWMAEMLAATSRRFFFNCWPHLPLCKVSRQFHLLSFTPSHPTIRVHRSHSPMACHSLFEKNTVSSSRQHCKSNYTIICTQRIKSKYSFKRPGPNCYFKEGRGCSRCSNFLQLFLAQILSDLEFQNTKLW